MLVSPDDEDVREALLLLIDSADHDGAELTSALHRAFAQARRRLADDLERSHTPELQERHEELDGYLSGETGGPLRYSTWLLVLSHFSAAEQRRLQREYEQLARGADATSEFGEPRAARVAARLMRALFPAEELIAELPHTTLERSEGVDDYVQRRHSLTIEVIEQPDSGDPSYTEPLRVIWRDGYHSLVATMTAGCYEQQLDWKLEIEDPSPGREASRFTPIASTAEEAARDDLQTALAWAAGELGDTYTIAPWPPDGDQPGHLPSRSI